ncbi:hypothetical protein L7F22_052214 [Adiantum nelumboides]|nr:hypothetical protein [Adiantum nelumboides]
MAFAGSSSACSCGYGGASPSFSVMVRQGICRNWPSHPFSSRKISTSGRVWALVVDPSDSAHGSVNEFAARMEKAWLISKQPLPVQCLSCKAAGVADCQWCKGTGFFILGDNLLCEVPSRNTTCLICLGKGTVPCKDCKGTGYIAQWLLNPLSKKKGS